MKHIFATDHRDVIVGLIFNKKYEELLKGGVGFEMI